MPVLGGATTSTGSLTIDPATTGYDIVIAAGQSNMEGHPTVAAPDARLDPADGRVWAFDQSGSYAQKIASAVEPLNHPGGPQGMGPAGAFARWYATTYPGRRVLIVPVAAGGTFLTTTATPRWDATLSGSLFDQMVTAAQRALTAAGTNSKIAACLWLQGENDSASNVPTATYRDALVTLIDTLRSRLSAPSLPFLICSMVPEVVAATSGYTAIDNAHKAIPGLRRYTSYTPGTTGTGIDVHYNSACQRLNGRALLLSGLPAALANTSATASPLIGPNQVTNLATGTMTNTTAPLTWTAASGATAYTVEHKTSAGSSWTTDTTSATGTSYTVTGLTLGTGYDFRVTATNANGSGLTSSVVTASTTGGSDSTAPTVPSNLTATGGNAQVVLSWTGSTDNVAVTGYRVRRNGTIIATPTTTTYTDTGLSNGTQYGYTVSAIDAAGNESAQTSTVNATPSNGTTVTETWTGTNGASWPSQWTTNGGTNTIQGNKGRLASASFFGNALLTGMTATTGDFDISVTLNMAGQTGNTDARVGVADAMPPAGTAPTNGYLVNNTFVANGTVGALYLFRYVGGVSTQLTQAFQTITTGPNGVKCRIQRVGTTIHAKTWTDGTAEPGTWLVTATDSTMTAAVKGLLAQTGGTAVTVDFDDYSITT